MPKPSARSSRLSTASSAYARFVAELKARIESARLSAARSVNRELIMLYWDIGCGIVEKQTIEGWGESVVERLAKDLSEAFPGMRGFSASNLWRMRQLFAALTAPDFLAQLARELAPKAKEPEILAQAVRELAGTIPWGQHVEMLNKLTDPAARFYYLKATAQFGWSRAVLLNQIKAQACPLMHRLPALLGNPLRLIGYGFGSGERLIAASLYVWFFPSAISRPPKPLGGADQAEQQQAAAPLGDAFVVKTGSVALRFRRLRKSRHADAGADQVAAGRRGLRCILGVGSLDGAWPRRAAKTSSASLHLRP